MTTALRLHYTYEEYTRFEKDAHERHEFVGGAILAMAGGTPEHARLTARVIASLGVQLGAQRCNVYDSNVRVFVQATGNAYYPDASVVCGRLETSRVDELAMVNPVLVVEVLSPSTAEYDRSEKLADYQRIPSMQNIVHVAHDECRIDVWTRGAQNDWTMVSYRDGDVATLDGIACTLDVRDVYRDPVVGKG